MLDVVRRLLEGARIQRLMMASLLSAVGLLGVAACSNSDPVVGFLEGSKVEAKPLEFSDFSPAANPTHSVSDKTISVTGHSPWIAFKAVTVSGAQNCSSADFSNATETALPGSFTIVTLTESTYKVCAIAKNAFGKWQEPSEATISNALIVDLTAPTSVLFTTQQPSTFNTLLTANFELSEAVQTLTNAAFSVTNGVITGITADNANSDTFTVTITPITQGTVSVTLVPAEIKDLAGNTFAGGALTFSRVYDTIAPNSPSIVIDGGASYSNSLSSFLALSASGSPSEMYITRDATCSTGGTWVAYQAASTTTLLANQTNTIYAKFRDSAGNETACVNDSIIQDSVLPVATFNSSAPSFVNASFTATLTLSEPLASALTNASFSVSNAVLTLSGSGTSYSLSITPSGSGTVTVNLPIGAIMDPAGNYALSGASLTRSADLTAPPAVTSLTAGAVPENFTQTPSFTFSTVTDSESGVNRYEGQIVDVTSSTVIKSWVAVTSPQQWTGLNLLENNDYRLDVRALDNAGNVSTTSSVIWRTYQRPYELMAWNWTPTGQVFALKQLVDDSLLVAGKFLSIGSSLEFRKFGVKLDSVGAVASGFSMGTGFDDRVLASQIQSDNKTLVAGLFTSYRGSDVQYIGRLNVDGSIDSAFSTASGFDAPVLTMVLDDQQRILVGGYFSSYRGVSTSNIARLNTDGTLDTTLVQGTGFNGPVLSIALQSTGKIIVGGSFTSYNGTAVGHLVRLLANGSIDNTFTIGTGFDSDVSSVAVQSTDRVLVAGTFGSFNSTPVGMLVRLTSSGTLDLTFNSGTGPNNRVAAIALQNDDKILIGGFFTHYDAIPRQRFARLDSDGSLDAGFTIGTGFSDFVQAIAVDASTGNIVVGGAFLTYDGLPANRLIRLDSIGGRDSTLSIGFGFDDEIATVSIYSNSSLFVGGAYTAYGGTAPAYLLKLTSSLVPDTSFNSNLTGAGPNGDVQTLAVQADGKVLLSGTFTTYNSNAVAGLCRITANGDFDATFAPGAGANSGITAVVVQPDQQILVGGSFTTFDGNTANRLVRLDALGNIDSGFNTSIGFNSNVNDVALASDGTIYAVGGFTTYNSVTSRRIAALQSSGFAKSGFNSGTGFDDQAFAVAVQSDGKVLVSGDFTTYNGTAVPRLVRLNSDGTLDTDFLLQSGLGPDGRVTRIRVDSGTGKILLIGSFASFNGTSAADIARLESTGALDTSVSLADGFDNTISDALFLTNGKMAVGGKYLDYNGNDTFNFSILRPPL